MPSVLQLDPATVTACVNDLLARSPAAAIRSIACTKAGTQMRVSLLGVRTGLSVFGMAVPPIDADVLLHGEFSAGRLRLSWSIERVVGIPAMAAKLVGKPALAKMLRDALGTRWGMDQALTADDAGDLVLDPAHLRIPGCAGLRIVSLAVPGGDGFALTAEWAWGK